MHLFKIDPLLDLHNKKIINRDITQSDRSIDPKRRYRTV